MNPSEIEARIALGRMFISNSLGDDPEYRTDQQLRRPQPPLVKAPMSDQRIKLPMDFASLDINHDFLAIVNGRQSRRIYTDEPISLMALSFLLWCSQGVKGIRGRAYATLRTVPSGGARHPFECYLAVRYVDGLKAGLYHYLPMEHSLEMLSPLPDVPDWISASLSGQRWADKASVVFYLSCVFYRAEWRYGIYAHAPVLMDSGHITENLYLAATALGLGGCAIAAVEPQLINAAFSLDGTEETAFYAMTVGTISDANLPDEDAIYAFVREEGL